MNSYLPRDVRVISSEAVVSAFHARRSARLRVYRYYTVCGPVLMPHLRNYRHWIRRSPDLARLNGLAAVLVGEHDFTCFSAEGDANLSKVRRVDASAFHRDGDTLVYTIAASSFLWKMVRTIIGTLFTLEEQGMGPRELRLVMDAGSRSNAGGTAPAKGCSWKGWYMTPDARSLKSLWKTLNLLEDWLATGFSRKHAELEINEQAMSAAPAAEPVPADPRSRRPSPRRCRTSRSIPRLGRRQRGGPRGRSCPHRQGDCPLREVHALRQPNGHGARRGIR